MASVWTVFVGGPNANVIFRNSGYQYATVYTHYSDIIAGNWLYRFAGQSTIYADHYAATKLALSNGSLPTDNVHTNVFDISSANNAYYYADWANVRSNVISISYDNTQLEFAFFGRYLGSSKNLVYSNGYAKVYK